MRPIVLAISLLAALAAGISPAATSLVAKWGFEKDAPGADSVTGAPDARIVKAVIVEGHEGTALEFEDWSVKNYLKPDPGRATRVIVAEPTAGEPVLMPPLPFRVSAWIYPTAHPVYYGGIVEKGEGYDAAYRLLIHRDLTIAATLAGHTGVRSAQPVSLNQWHEVVLAAGTKTLRLFVDGTQVGSSDLAPGSAASAAASRSDLVIGERFTGRIDEVSIARP